MHIINTGVNRHLPPRKYPSHCDSETLCDASRWRLPRPEPKGIEWESLDYSISAKIKVEMSPNVATIHSVTESLCREMS